MGSRFSRLPAGSIARQTNSNGSNVVDLPDGVIDSPEFFVDAVRLARAMPGTEQDEADNRKFLQAFFEEYAAKIDGNWRDNDRRYRMMFWTGALTGLRIANRGYLQRLKQLAFDSSYREGKITPQ
jgi:hypothetical protein